MNNLPLKSLGWDWVNPKDKHTNVVCRAKTPSHEYLVRMNAGGEIYVDYYKFDNSEGKNNRKDEAPVFDSIKAAQEWVELTHYPSKMQPYVVPSPTKVYELAFDCDDSYFTVFMTTDKQAALDFMESVKDADQDFISSYGFDDDADEATADRYNDTHPLKPYASKIFDPIYEDSFSEYANNYVGESLASQLNIIEHELFSTMQNLHKGE